MSLQILSIHSKTYWDDHPLIASMIVFICVFSIFSFIKSHAGGDPVFGDHYFHFKYAQLLRTEGLNAVNNFSWICTSEECNGSRYAVNLFQISLIPFTLFKNTLFGMTLADIFYASGFFGIVYYVMRKSRVRYPLFFVLLMFTSSYFVMRLLIGRAFVFATAFVFLEMYFAINKKYKPFFVMCFLHVLWHQNTYFVPVMVVGAVEVARYLAINKVYWKNIMVSIFAVIIGMAFFPGFPNSLITWMGDIISIQSGSYIGSEVHSISGNELDPKDFMSYFATNTMSVIFLIFGIMGSFFLYVLQKKNDLIRIEKAQIMWIYTLFLFLIITLFGTIVISGRFFDFFYPTIFVLSGFIITLLIRLDKIKIDDLLSKFLKVSLGIFVFVVLLNVSIKIYEMSNQFDQEPARKVSKWIQDNSQDGENVFLSNWGFFTIMFFNNHDNKYSLGLEPNSLKSKNVVKYWKYYNIFRYNYYCDTIGDCKEELEYKKKLFKGFDKQTKKMIEKKNSENIVRFIKNDFHSRFIVSDSHVLNEIIKMNPEMIEDSYYVKSEKFNGSFMEFTVFKLK